MFYNQVWQESITYHHTVNGAVGIILYLGTKIFFYINVCRFDGGKPGEMYAVSRLMHWSYVFYLGCLEGQCPFADILLATSSACKKLMLPHLNLIWQIILEISRKSSLKVLSHKQTLLCNRYIEGKFAHTF